MVSLFDLYVIEREKQKLLRSTAVQASSNGREAPLLSGGINSDGASTRGSNSETPELTEILHGLFTKFDADGNGSIDKSELRAVMVGSIEEPVISLL